MKKKYLVYGWLSGAAFDKNLSADCKTVVTTTDQDKAEDIADKRFKKKVGTCDVVDTQWSCVVGGRPVPTNPGVGRTCKA